ncbi:RagB/SusD family nutrient uptake outer membrane protein [Flavilitoribacter nigricans]|uniref:RagB/SusD family nutrient uptake outer membrane protein n=1 Tax=Flavilitoribacter nigricans (strain ATCC 23147 / DSM 23189 / NBRC 102662 / NCIMB 1420 / SS-2) TaxID=1122177 RepID=A0A2D0N2V7_FLAN2|nr:RagB/SusD family nutrient uptake outer membrane protein [Flavilitoribacter nigricans]PHN02716.1 RagB/SusD family nutrient uptake outer membrane protein [Flavilitoribacter nigricans DSM 23189 = NBRC 102662]
MKNIKFQRRFQLPLRAFGSAFMIFGLLLLSSCEDSFLDVVPDNVATVDQAFSLRNEAEKYLFTCYSYLPKNGDGLYNIAMLSGDELWIPPQDLALNSFAFDVARGLQRSFDTYMDVWEGRWQGGGPNDLYPLFDGIRHCNIFLENIEDRGKVPDLQEAERLRWIAEAKFLKAYYHFYLMRMYGPIPIMRESIPIDAPESELFVAREPVDDVVDYIVQLLDEATPNLPQIITDSQNELGRITKSISTGLKADVLLTAASPLFNGNSDMSGFTTREGVPFFDTGESTEKWQRAADAAKTAIETAEASGHELYTFSGGAFALSPKTNTKLSISQALADRTSKEVIWRNTQSLTWWLQLQCAWPINSAQPDWTAQKILAPTLKMARLFYTKNGVPIEEDKTLDFSDIDEVQTAEEADNLDIAEGYRTARLNFDREPRFYADLAFDGAIYYLESSGANEKLYHLRSKFKDYAGSNDVFHYNVTGYYLKKLIDYRYNYTSFHSYREYAWPEMRLTELYLAYAEALNEAQGPVEEVFTYLDKVRARAGLEGVKASWDAYSTNPSKYTTKDGLRKIIQQERGIELAFEGKRYWDIRRWKLAAKELNEPVQGWNIYGENEESYYQVTTIFRQRFASPRDYFWPISEYTRLQNPNLVQNPGW